MTEADYILIEKYLDDQLAEGERMAVEQRMATDTAFAQELALRQEMQAWLKQENHRQNILSEIAQQNAIHFTTETALPEQPVAQKRIFSPSVLRWSVAAALALLLMVVWRTTGHKKQDLYDTYAQHTPLSITVRSAGSQATKAENAFNNAQYAEAKQAIGTLLELQPDDTQLRLYGAICDIETGAYTEARATLQGIAEGTSVWVTEAQWHMALSYLKEGDKAKCAEVLRSMVKGNGRYAKAQELLKALEE